MAMRLPSDQLNAPYFGRLTGRPLGSYGIRSRMRDEGKKSLPVGNRQQQTRTAIALLIRAGIAIAFFQL
jgi:hypothetical protein